MENSRTLTDVAVSFMEQIQIMSEQVSWLENRITAITSKLGKFDEDLDTIEEYSLYSGDKELCSTESIQALNPPNIISFPGSNKPANRSICRTKQLMTMPIFHADPGKALSSKISDFRPLLQRDGLILLAWDVRKTEAGERCTAYWVTSAGIPRFYASKPLSLIDFSRARPDHKSYAAEDGIEFYGQESPVYMVHVAPELMMSSPRHRELRQSHIQMLKQQGSTMDFNYKYSLKTEKKGTCRTENQNTNSMVGAAPKFSGLCS